MTKHLFSSGEILNKQNEKELAEGRLCGDTLEYGEIGDDTQYTCNGLLEGKTVRVLFTLADESRQFVKFRRMLGILMQSDIMEGVWESYEVAEPQA